MYAYLWTRVVCLHVHLNILFIRCVRFRFVRQILSRAYGVEDVQLIDFIIFNVVLPLVKFLLCMLVIIFHPSFGEHDLSRFIPLHVTDFSNAHSLGLFSVPPLVFPGFHVLLYPIWVLRKFTNADGSFPISAVETAARWSLGMKVPCVSAAIVRSIYIPVVASETALAGE